MRHFIDRLAQNLQRPLPGQPAQYRMAHAVRRHQSSPPPDARQAGVMALLFPAQGHWHLTFIQRVASNPNDRHSGQISFPGGKREPSDESLLQTALRETHEEIGVSPVEVTVLGALTPLYIPVSNFEVHPFVGYAEAPPVFSPQASEVTAVLTMPIDYFSDPANMRKTDLTVAPNITLKSVPYFDLNGEVLWGATAMILSELLAVAEDATN